MIGLSFVLNDSKDPLSSSQTKVKQLADYMKDRMRYPIEHQVWAFKFFFCEILNFVNVIAQVGGIIFNLYEVIFCLIGRLNLTTLVTTSRFKNPTCNHKLVNISYNWGVGIAQR